MLFSNTYPLSHFLLHEWFNNGNQCTNIPGLVNQVYAFQSHWKYFLYKKYLFYNLHMLASLLNFMVNSVVMENH